MKNSLRPRLSGADTVQGSASRNPADWSDGTSSAITDGLAGGIGGWPHGYARSRRDTLTLGATGAPGICSTATLLVDAQ